MNRIQSRSKYLSAIISAILATVATGHASNVQAATITVTNCNDSGSGSLRNSIASALSGDRIDLSALACGRINLTSGSIAIAQNDLEMVGPGARRLNVDAGQRSSVFRHSGIGALTIRELTITRGYYASSSQAFGGCIYSNGSVRLEKSHVHWCMVKATGFARAFGAGIYAARSVSLKDSGVTGNTGIDIGAYRQPEGGGIYALGHLTAVNSRICGNHAKRAGGAWVGHDLSIGYTTISDNDGGALEATGKALIYNTTISNNKNAWWTMTLDGVWNDVPISIVNTTISGNKSVYETVNMSRGTRSIFNSTIVYNQHAGGCLNAAVFTTGDIETQVESTIAAKNTCDGAPYVDIGGFADMGDALVGANNLIMSTNLSAPADTIAADPFLEPLADNGGPTKTHALLPSSPALNTGNNALGLDFDQRGDGFPRVNGPRADIGAFEH